MAGREGTNALRSGKRDGMIGTVYPNCPFCGTKYIKEKGDRTEKATEHHYILVRCYWCKERFYVGRQIRYVARRSMS